MDFYIFSQDRTKALAHNWNEAIDRAHIENINKLERRLKRLGEQYASQIDVGALRRTWQDFIKPIRIEIASAREQLGKRCSLGHDDQGDANMEILEAVNTVLLASESYCRDHAIGVYKDIHNRSSYQAATGANRNLSNPSRLVDLAEEIQSRRREIPPEELAAVATERTAALDAFRKNLKSPPINGEQRTVDQRLTEVSNDEGLSWESELRLVAHSESQETWQVQTTGGADPVDPLLKSVSESLRPDAELPRLDLNLELKSLGSAVGHLRSGLVAKSDDIRREISILRGDLEKERSGAVNAIAKELTAKIDEMIDTSEKLIETWCNEWSRSSVGRGDNPNGASSENAQTTPTEPQKEIDSEAVAYHTRNLRNALSNRLKALQEEVRSEVNSWVEREIGKNLDESFSVLIPYSELVRSIQSDLQEFIDDSNGSIPLLVHDAGQLPAESIRHLEALRSAVRRRAIGEQIFQVWLIRRRVDQVNLYQNLRKQLEASGDTGITIVKDRVPDAYARGLREFAVLGLASRFIRSYQDNLSSVFVEDTLLYFIDDDDLIAPGYRTRQ